MDEGNVMMTSGYIDGKQTPTYRIWAGMKNRCLNHKNKDFHHYGAKGISVCERWLSYAAFLADMGERPPGLTLDRLDGTKDYEPGNCRWATRKQQRENTANWRGIDYDELGVTSSAVSHRIRRGWPVDQAKTVPRSSRWSGRVA